MKKYYSIILLALLAIIFIFLGIRFLGGAEDDWICQNGEWVAHGKPNDTKPIISCEK